VSDVWGAACHAQRINGAYCKEDHWEWPSETATAMQLNRKSNRNIMMEALENPFMITDEDRSAGEACLKFISNDMTFRALQNKLTDFDRSVMKITAVTDKFFPQQHRLELATVACLPNSHQRALKRIAEQDRINQTAGYIGTVGDKVTVNVDIVRCIFSQKWNTYYATAITANNETVFFSIREPLNTGTLLAVQGTVKAEPLMLINGSEKLTLRFDCKPCEMHVVGKMKKSVLNQRVKEMTESPMTFYKTRPSTSVR
jgi:hypothetical protein